MHLIVEGYQSFLANQQSRPSLSTLHARDGGRMGTQPEKQLECCCNPYSLSSLECLPQKCKVFVKKKKKRPEYS